MKALVSILIPAYNSTGPCRVRLFIRTVKEQIQAVVLPLPRPTEKRLRLRTSSASFATVRIISSVPRRVEKRQNPAREVLKGNRRQARLAG